MFVQEKKVGARRHECLLLKKSLFVPVTVTDCSESSSWKSKYPQSMTKVSVNRRVPTTSAQMWTTQGVCLLGELVSTSLATPSVWLPPFSLSWIDLSKEIPQHADLGLILLHWIHCCWVGSECQRMADLRKGRNDEEVGASGGSKRAKILSLFYFGGTPLPNKT